MPDLVVHGKTCNRQKCTSTGFEAIKLMDMEKSLMLWKNFGKHLQDEYIMKFYANDSVALSRAIRETEELLQRLKEGLFFVEELLSK